MPIFEKQSKRILFAHVPKTGGISITKMAATNGWKIRNRKRPHATIEEYRRWKRDATFSIVRDPVERMKSLLAHFRVPQRRSFQWLGALFREYHRLGGERGSVGPMIFPQVRFVGGEWAIYGEEDEILERYLGTSQRERVNTPVVPKYDLCERSIELVKTFYREDYERFFNGGK